MPEINVGTTRLQPSPLLATPRSWKVCFSPEIDILHTYGESLFERPSLLLDILFPGGGGDAHTLPIRVCTAQRGRDFEAPGLERSIHFRGVF